MQYTILTNKEWRYKTKMIGTDKIQGMQVAIINYKKWIVR